VKDEKGVYISKYEIYHPITGLVRPWSLEDIVINVFSRIETFIGRNRYLSITALFKHTFDHQ
jgi:hypothetical protein